MPTYGYRCDTCGHQFELFQRMTDDPVDTCPECQSRVRRVIHPVGVVFKGSGWYINDSRAKSGANGASKSSDSDSDSSKGKDKDTSKGGESTKSEPVKAETAKTAAD